MDGGQSGSAAKRRKSFAVIPQTKVFLNFCGGSAVDKFTYIFSEERGWFIANLFTIIFHPRRIRIGCFFGRIIDDSSSLKEQSLVREAKACSHLKALRIAPGNWGKVGAA